MAVNPLSIPGYATPLDITGQLSDLTKTINNGQKMQSLAELGRGLADGTLDYKQAAAKTAALGDLGTTMSLLKLGQEQQNGRDLQNSIASLYGSTPQTQSTSFGLASGPTVPNDSNAMPGTVGMNQRLADLSQDFMQDNPNTYLSSGVRSTADQARLYADRANNPNPVAVPGTSHHERGLAVDIGGMSADQRAILPQYGLAQPVANDPPHVELAQAASAPAIGQIDQNGPTREQIAALAANPATRPFAIDLLKAKMTGAKFKQETDADGNIWNVNLTNGQRMIALKADKDQFSIQKVENPDGSTSFIRVQKSGVPGVIDTGQPQNSAGGNPFTSGGKFNSEQGKASGFTDRMLQSEGILSGIGGKGGVQGEGTSAVQAGLSAIPGVGNFLIGKDRQKYEQAKRDFVNAQLRRESGAAISPSEFESANKQYFPMPGDSAEVIQQKAANRRAAIEAMGREGGPSYRPKYSFNEKGNVVPRQAQQPLQINTPQQYQALPSGTQYIAPDGSLRTKQ